MALVKKTVVTRGRRTKDISGDRYGKYVVKNMADFCRRYGLDKANLHTSIKTGWKHRGYSAQHV